MKIKDLDDLQRSTEKILALLKDRHTGLASWSALMMTNLQDLHEYTSNFFEGEGGLIG